MMLPTGQFLRVYAAEMAFLLLIGPLGARADVFFDPTHTNGGSTVNEHPLSTSKLPNRKRARQECGYPKRHSPGVSLVVHGVYWDENSGLCKEDSALDSGFSFPFHTVQECEDTVSQGLCNSTLTRPAELNVRPANSRSCSADGLLTVAFWARLFSLPDDLRVFQQQFTFAYGGERVGFEFWPNAKTSGDAYLHLTLRGRNGRKIVDPSCKTQEAFCQEFATAVGEAVMNPLRYCKPDYDTLDRPLGMAGGR